MAKHVLVIGELNVDLIISGLAGLPQLGQEVVCTGYARALGSSSAIFARALAGLGARVDFIGKVGDDDNGRFMVGQLEELGIGTEGVIVDQGLPTGVTISLTYPHEKAQITYPGSIAAFSGSDVNIDRFARYDHLHMASMYLQTGLRADFPALLLAAKERGLTTSLDPGWDPAAQWDLDVYETLAAVNILFVNEHELRALGRTSDVAQGVRALGRWAPLVVGKLGPRGMVVADGERLVEVPGYAVDVVDTTGAGDSCDAGFIYAYVVEGRSVEAAARFANACGAIAVTRVGGASSVPSAAEVEAFRGQWAVRPTMR